jgi:hypothetical protein
MIDTIYRCRICGEESQNPIRWLVIDCNSARLTVFNWTKQAAAAPPLPTIPGNNFSNRKRQRSSKQLHNSQPRGHFYD